MHPLKMRYCKWFYFNKGIVVAACNRVREEEKDYKIQGCSLQGHIFYTFS